MQPPNTFQYVVKPGDTLYRIAYRFSIRMETLLAANPQLGNPSILVPGQILYVPRRSWQLYVIQPGDTLYKIGRKFGVTVAQLQSVNPGIDPNRLQIGEVINIPDTLPATIVVPREDYGYDEMMADLQTLQSRFSFVNQEMIGESVLGRPIPVVNMGSGRKQVFYSGSFHANEWMTTILLMRFIEEYAKAYELKRTIGRFHIPTLFAETSLWIVPMVNPDGVELVQEGITPDNPYFEEVLTINGGSRDFSQWKANIRGVDLNDQFPAHWQEEVARRAVDGPAPRNYPGVCPLFEPESKAMADFTSLHDFRLVIAFHSQGEEIFGGYREMEPPESEEIARIFTEASGYRTIRYVDSDAGFKDWFIQQWRRPGFTVEVGRGTNPLPISQFWDIWGKTIGILLAGLAV
ncbi:M14 family metallopeptidase [Effusibacillus dendaii]|uniref:Peptidase M14 n=1 Tax=Effusibacillus dendaii TaxID=2743772 RepID=A0A7I8DDD8_9BACL|nr:M14 family metallopeptidase [Effusibacillus dendaii]BCJ86969.1 peptidase M14 [Effusibacillus dendaii]